MSKKSKRKNNLKESIILLLLLILLLVSSTYAWFTANQTVTISSIDVTIEAKNGLQISTDATSWKSIISNDDIKSGYTGHANSLPTSMEPVSSVLEIDSETGYMKMFYGTVNADEETGKYELTATQSAENSGQFVAFDVFLRVDKETTLKLTTDSNVKKSGDSDKGIKQASRVAFTVQGNGAVGDDVDELTKMKAGTDSPVYLWEPNAYIHTDAAIAHAKSSYGLTVTATDGLSAAPIEYYGIKAPITDGIELINTNSSSASSTYFALVEPDYTPATDVEGVMEAEEEVFTLAAGITKVRIYMWIEGQDIDCENTASGTDISFNVQLQVVDDTVEGA